MSVRATERLIGDVVIASGLSNSPKMVVQGIDIEAKLVTAVWFSDDHTGQIAVFPASSLDRWEAPATPVKKTGTAKAAAGKKTEGKKK
jgi:prophage tail gpP-like protein